MTSGRNSNVQLLATLVDYSDVDESEYRFLVDGKHVKYVTVDPGVLPKDDRALAPILLPLLPLFPPGDWNEGHISKDPLLHDVPLLCEMRTKLHRAPSLLPLYADRSYRAQEAPSSASKHPRGHASAFRPSPPRQVCRIPLAKTLLRGRDNSVRMDRWPRGASQVPRSFHRGRESHRVRDGDDARSVQTGDLAACQAVLAKLHSRGIKHGDMAAGEIAGSKQCCRGSSIPTPSNPPRTSAMG